MWILGLKGLIELHFHRRPTISYGLTQYLAVKELFVIFVLFAGTILETEASTSDHNENATGVGPSGREDLYRQVSWL